MEFLSSLIGAGASILSGGLTGLAGVAVQRVFDWLNKREEAKEAEAKRAHERDLRRIDGELMDKEWAHRVRVAEVEAAGREAVADAGAFAASLTAEPKRYTEGMKPPSGGKIAKAAHGLGWLLMVLVDAVRGAIRPGLTIYLAVIATLMYEQSAVRVSGLDVEAHPALFAEVHKGLVYTLLYLFTTCVLWWFGTRNKQPAPRFGGGRP